MKKSNKLGQFYLISAIIIATTLASIFVVSNYIKKGPETNIIDIDEEMKTESRYLIEYGLNKKLTEEQIHSDMSDFRDAYVSYTQGDNDFYFIFATENKLTVLGYQNEAKTITINGEQVITSERVFTKEIPTPTQANLIIDGTPFQFTINAQDTGEDFYSIVTDSTGLIAGEDLEVSSGFVESDFPPTITTATANNQEPGTTITIDPDTTIDLVASATGKPAPTYSWALGTQTASGSSTTMTPESSGALTLTATNSEGSDSKTWNVVVNAPVPQCNYHEEYATSTACPGATQAQADAWCVSYSQHTDAVSTWSPACNGPPYNEINCRWCESPTKCMETEGGGSAYTCAQDPNGNPDCPDANNEENPTSITACQGSTQVGSADAFCKEWKGSDATVDFNCNSYGEVGCNWPSVCVLWGPA